LTITIYRDKFTFLLVKSLQTTIDFSTGVNQSRCETDPTLKQHVLLLVLPRLRNRQQISFDIFE